ncbi:MAG: ribbon-helix-helix domain-containing protein [Patescibacteria group bacterium]
MRTTTNVSITVAPSLLKEANGIAKREGRTQSGLFREALRRYIMQAQFRQLQNYGKTKAKAMGIKSSDVNRLIHEYRQEKRTAAKNNS